jgi:uncharacterized protein (TIGR03118 family)
MTRRASTVKGATHLRPAGGSRARRWSLGLVVGAVTGLTASLAVPAAASPADIPGGFHFPGGFQQINMVSDQADVAPLTDSNLVNAWGLSASPGTDTSPGSPLWVSDNGKDKTTLFAGNPAGSPTGMVTSPLTVDVTSGTPTGQVFNPGSSGFVVTDSAGHSGTARFMFATESGAIDGWNSTVGATAPGLSTHTEVAVNNGANAVYKGLAIATASDGHQYLYAANFRSGRVEAYDNTFTPVELPGGLFVDPRIPAGYAPFNVAELNGQLYVTYAKQDGTLHDDVAGQGHGFVDVFTNDGAFVRRLVTRGVLNSPWGMALAPQGFGRFGGALLVGNFGNGQINAFDPTTGRYEGALRGSHGQPIAIDGLWGLMFGNGNAAKTNELLFSAGPDDESHGLLGKIVAMQ